ncbi:sugar ABC transporter permease [Orenia metallireducens]|jgi:multiple sugar transport system permease protein|uniref:Sugar ABC transporter permease n=1 Tax=Orenia metallireducens TaxID=1413210 RepID=A0A1C0A6X5_9FIRM|nr:carbohydrate ABC transporter permease [Orenia metallireducens]OCL25982.1 sugar ABC transporter permease [Orenia metallireducens]
MEKIDVEYNEIGTSKVNTEKVWSKIKTGLMYFVLVLGVVITIFPFYYMLVLATKSNAEIFSFPPPLWFGDSFSDNLSRLLSVMPFYRNILNSIFVATVATIATVFFCSLGGYGFAKYDFKYKEKLFFIMLATMMIPGLLSIIPWFIMMTKFGWVNTFKPLIIPGMANAFGIFLMRQFMEDIPDEIIEAARIDGCGEFEIFFRIILPMSLPGLGTLGLLTFLTSWNNYMAALLILQDKAMYTIPVALSKLGGKVDNDWGAQMVGTTLAIAPIIIAFVAASKQFISGITEGATKG